MTEPTSSRVPETDTAIRPDETPTTSFWDHLDELRRVLFKGLMALGIVCIAAFCFKKPLFDILLYPRQAAGGAEVLPMISTQLTSQFSAHLKAAFMVSILICLPYWLYLLFRFLKPALYPNEKKAVGRVFSSRISYSPADWPSPISSCSRSPTAFCSPTASATISYRISRLIPIWGLS